MKARIAFCSAKIFHKLCRSETG